MKLTREELYELVWSQPMIKLAETFEISDVGLRKRCKKLNIPLPPQGYFLRAESARKGERPPLPPLEGNEIIQFTANKAPNVYPLEEEAEVKAQIEFERFQENRITVPSKLSNPHILVNQFKESLKNLSHYETGTAGIISKWGELLNISASQGCMDRALRIMDSLIKALEKRKYSVSVSKKGSNSRAHVTTASVLGETVMIRLRESYTQKKHVPFPDPKKNSFIVSSYPAYDYFPSGSLSLCIEEFLHGVKLVWSDGKKRKLEDELNDFIVALVRVAVVKRKRRLERQREERDRIDRQMQWFKQEEFRKQEQERLDTLLEEASNWRKSNLLREYIKAVTEEAIKRHGKIEAGSKLDQWIKWANDRADFLDPLVSSEG